MKVAFFGTPTFAIQSLQSIIASKNHKVVCVVTQPDKPTGRGGKVQMPPVKEFAVQNNIPVLQPERISNEINILDEFAPDIIVTCAFGQLLKQNVLDYCKHGVINVHASLLPKYRGSSPIQWAIIDGETQTGVTIMQTELGLDTGDIIIMEKLDINPNETAGELFGRLADLGAKLLTKALDNIQNGTATRTPQKHELATKPPMIKKEDGKIDWSRSAAQIKNQIRGMNPWPIAFFQMGDEIIRVHRAGNVTTQIKGKVGEVITADKTGFVIQCGNGTIHIEQLQSSGGKILSYREFLNGKKIPTGTILG
ncbi:MAG: methionyl-tRNA formyltransferase [Firmicutes bacterium]|nr:methionyl-tRNA formyltransferase [Bacillota bacterium]